MTRKMASIREIEEIKAIDGADSIEAARIGGWYVVVKKSDNYNVNDKVIYCEIDSWVPTSVAPFLTKPEHFPKEYNGIKGERLRTVKLRGQLSQGLILPLSIMGDEYYKDRSERGLKNCWVKPIGDTFIGATDEIGADVSQYLGISKWELPEVKHADAKGNFPHFFPKTDQERIQNCFKDVKRQDNQLYYVEEKIDGSSHSAYLYDGAFGVCSRNLELKDSDNTFWNNARNYKLEEILRSEGKNLVIQSEQIGTGINGNIYGLNGFALVTFDIFDIDKQKYYSTEERNLFCKKHNLTIPPVVSESFDVQSVEQVQTLLEYADGDTKVQGSKKTAREGLIFRSHSDKRFTFKAISNKWLLKHNG